MLEVMDCGKLLQTAGDKTLFQRTKFDPILLQTIEAAVSMVT